MMIIKIRIRVCDDDGVMMNNVMERLMMMA